MYWKQETHRQAFNILWIIWDFDQLVPIQSDSSTKKGFPHRLDKKFHPYVSSKPKSQYQYYMWVKLKMNP